MTRGRQRGSSVVEALVGAVLASVALGGLAGAAGLATYGLALARDTSVALALASERLESLRVGVRVDGTDTTVAPHGTTYDRSWQVTPGRGDPDRLSVEIVWGTRRLSLTTEAPP
jgi:Tfp pilus assembly protein PilV